MVFCGNGVVNGVVEVFYDSNDMRKQGENVFMRVLKQRNTKLEILVLIK